MQEKIQNIHQKFNAPQNEIRLAIMNFIVDHHRPFSLKEDGYTALKGITLSSAEDFSSITEVLCEKDGMVTDEEGNVNFIYPVSALPTNHHVTLADGREFCAMCCNPMQSVPLSPSIRIPKSIPSAAPAVRMFLSALRMAKLPNTVQLICTL